MSSIWIAAVVLAVAPADADTPVVESSSLAVVEYEALFPAKTGRELLGEAHDTLARWAKPDDCRLGLAADQFVVLYRQIEIDAELARSQRDPMLKKIRGRLLAIQRRLQKRIAIQQRLAKRQKRPASVSNPTGRHELLAQMGGFGGGAFGGGPGMMGGGFGGPQAGVRDHGEQLVELIQQTIAPSTWDINGGAGSIYYWAPGQALVIRNQGDVHGRVGGLLGQLNRLGR